MAKKRPAPTREDALRVARYLGCRGAHQDDSGTWFPCADSATLMRLSNEAEPKSAKRKKRGTRRRFVTPGYEKLGERGVLSIDTLEGGGLVSGKDDAPEKFEEYELLDLKANNYTKPRLRESIKRRIMAGSRGGKPGEWSARKAQLLAIEYRRAGGGYRGPKKAPQRSLDKWTGEEWTTSDGKPAIREGGTTRYLPKKAWEKLSPGERAATNRKKRRASRTGRQFVANTERAREAGRRARQSEKSIIIGRAKPRRGDPDVYDDPNAARLRSRALGCIGIARRVTPDGEIVWTPCTNVSDFRRRTGQSVLSERDEVRRLQRRLREVGGPEFFRRRASRLKVATRSIDYKALTTIGQILGQGFDTLGRRANSGRCRGLSIRDGDGDGFICNPATGKDDLPLVGNNPELRQFYDNALKARAEWAAVLKKNPFRKDDISFNTPSGDSDRMLENLAKRGWLIERDGNTIKLTPPFEFRKRYLAYRAYLGESNVLPIAGKDSIFNIGYHVWHPGNDIEGPEKEIASAMLKNFGYDPLNDTLYSPFFRSPNTYDQIKDVSNLRAYVKGVIPEFEGAPGGEQYLSDAPNAPKYKKPGTLDSEYLSNISELDIEQAVANFNILKDSVRLRNAKRNPQRSPEDDDDDLEDILSLEEAGYGYEEIASILNYQPTIIKDFLESNGFTPRESRILSRLEELKRERAKRGAKPPRPENNKPKVGGKPIYRQGENAKPPKLNLRGARVEDPITYADYKETLAWLNYQDRNFRLPIPPDELTEQLRENPRLARIVSAISPERYKQIVGNNVVPGVRVSKQDNDMMHDYMSRFFFENVQSLVDGRPPKEFNYLGVSKGDMRMILHIIMGSGSTEEKRRTLNERGLFQTYSDLHWLGLMPLLSDAPKAMEVFRGATPQGKGLLSSGNFEMKSSLRTIGSLIGRASARPTRRRGQRFANMAGSRIDGDGDGYRTDPRTGKDNIPVSPAIGGIASLMERLKDPDGGFTFSVSAMDDVRSGWAIARKGQGIRIPVDKVFDDDGNVTEEGLDHLEAFLEMHRELFQATPGKNRQISIGGWHDPETKQIYFDVTDVHSKDSMSLEQAVAEAKNQNQISIVDLDELRAAQANNDWKDRTVFHSGGGDGKDLVSETRLNKYLEMVRSGEIDERVKERRNDPSSAERRVVISDDGVDMMFAKPVEELSDKHGIRRDWQDVRALPQPRRKEIADLYDEAEDVPAEQIQEEVREAYQALVLEVEEQFEMLTKELKVNVEFVDEDPYENFYEMLEDFKKNKRLKILRTSVTGGHPFMTDEQNDKFRAVHDAFGHLATGRGFDRHGEEAAYQAHKSMFSETAAKAAATELRGQNAFLIERGFFGPQKLILLPEVMRKFLEMLLGHKEAKKPDKMTAQDWSDFDNAYTQTRSHHVSCGRAFRD